MPEGEELPDDVLNHLLAQTYHISPLEVESWPYLKRRRYLVLTQEMEAGIKDRQAIENFKRGNLNPTNSPQEEGGSLSASELKALQEEAESKYGRWQS